MSKAFDYVTALIKKTEADMEAYQSWLQDITKAAAKGLLGGPFEPLPEEREDGAQEED